MKMASGGKIFPPDAIFISYSGRVLFAANFVDFGIARCSTFTTRMKLDAVKLSWLLAGTRQDYWRDIVPA